MPLLSDPRLPSLNWGPVDGEGSSSKVSGRSSRLSGRLCWNASLLAEVLAAVSTAAASAATSACCRGLSVSGGGAGGDAPPASPQRILVTPSDYNRVQEQGDLALVHKVPNDVRHGHADCSKGQEHIAPSDDLIRVELCFGCLMSCLLPVQQLHQHLHLIAAYHSEKSWQGINLFSCCD